MGSNTVNVSRSRGSANIVWLSLLCVLCALPTPARSQQPAQNSEVSSPELPSTQTPAGPEAAQPSNPQAPGSISGKVIDQTGVSITGAKVTLTRDNPSTAQDLFTDDDGLFAFASVAPGPFHLTISSPNLTPQTFDDTLQPGQAYTFPLVMLSVATQVTEVHVNLSPEEVATLEVKDEEKQRVLGIVPNYFVSFSPNPESLPQKLKYHLAWKSASDPFTLGAVGALAGVEQATNKWKSYGQGVKGYSKRFGANYADVAIGTFMSNAILPSIFKQDPRYFYKGTGSKRSRVLYALRSAFVAKSDDGRWVPNYSDLIGSAITGGIANAYHPASNRGVGLVFSTMLTRIGEITAASLFDEFLGPKFTSHVPASSANQP